jgi:hypothetical protein
MLSAMAHAKQDVDWQRHSFLLAMIYNRAGFGSTDPKTPDEMNFWKQGADGIGGGPVVPIEISHWEMCKLRVRAGTQ